MFERAAEKPATPCVGAVIDAAAIEECAFHERVRRDLTLDQAHQTGPIRRTADRIDDTTCRSEVRLDEPTASYAR